MPSVRPTTPDCVRVCPVGDEAGSFPSGNLRFRFADLRFRFADLRFRFADLRFRFADLRFRFADLRFRFADLRFRFADLRFRFADLRFVANAVACRLRAPFDRLRTCLTPQNNFFKSPLLNVLPKGDEYYRHHLRAQTVPMG